MVTTQELVTALDPRFDRGAQFTTGRVFYVHSSGSDSAQAGETAAAPFATLDFAIGQCSANNGDLIYVMPGHAETLTAAGQLDFDIAGVRAQGLGWGTTRPTFTLRFVPQ